MENNRGFVDLGNCLSRRQILTILGAGIAALLLPGCGGSSEIGVPNTGTSGTVNTAEIGGSGLQVATAESTTSASGGFNIPDQTSVGARALAVLDQNGKLRALGVAGASSRPIELGAQSTVESLIFGNPGIYAPDPAQAEAVLNSIRALPAFSDALARAKAILPTGNVADLVADAAFETAMSASVQQYIANHTGQRGLEVGPEQNGFSVILPGTTAPQSVSATLKNRASRFIRVLKREYDAGGVVLRTSVVASGSPGELAGSMPNQFYGYFWADAYSTTVDQPEDYTTVAKTEYWVEGPGDPAQKLPTGMASNLGEAWGLSLVLYAAVPMIMYVLGWDRMWSAMTTDSAKNAYEVWNAISSVPGVSQNISAVASATDKTDAYYKMSRAIIPIVQAILEEPTAYQAAGLSASQANLALRWIGYIVSATFNGTINSYPYTWLLWWWWLQSPAVAMVAVTSTGDGEVIIE